MKNTPAAGNVRAKTGTMSNIRSLAGYVKTRDGETLAFVAMVNNFEGTGAAANQALDRSRSAWRHSAAADAPLIRQSRPHLRSLYRRSVRLQPDCAAGSSK